MTAKRAYRSFAFRSDYRLPAVYTAEIGRLIVRWAFLDHQLNTIVWRIAFGADEKVSADSGRLAIPEKPLPDRLKLIGHLASVRKVKLDQASLKSIKSRSKPLVEERNLLAHGTWSKEKRRWYVKQTRGDWPEAVDGPRGPKKLTPEAAPRSPSQIKKTVTEVERLIEDVLTFKLSIVGP